MLSALAVANMQSARTRFTAEHAESALKGTPSLAHRWAELAYGDGDGEVPMLKTLEQGAVPMTAANGLIPRPRGVYRFRDPMLQEALATEAAAGTPHWRSDGLMRIYLKNESNHNMLRIGGGYLGTKLARRRPDWSLAHAGVGDVVCGVVASLIEGNAALTKLDLSGNEMLRSDSGKALGRALEGNVCLTELSLRGAQLGPDGGAALARGLKANAALVSLDCSGTGLPSDNVGAAGAVAIVEALQWNDTLSSLKLDYNSIGPAGVAKLTLALARNESLRVLSLFDNGLRPEGGLAFVLFYDSRKTKHRSGLARLDLRSNAFGEEVKAELEFADRRHPKLSIVL